MARETEEQREKRFRAHCAKVNEQQTREAAAELDAMREALAILRDLPEGSRKRALRWLGDRLDNLPDPARTFDAYSDEPPF